MKQKILTLLFCLATLAATAQIQPTTALIGSWSGKLKFGPMSLTLVLHLEQADGYVTATFDSPDQGAKGIPAMKEFLSDDSLAVGVESLDMTYCAKLKEGRCVCVCDKTTSCRASFLGWGLGGLTGLFF